ncbi:hypothetical protein [Bacillus sp. Hm123]|uniref:hypothetical protein n=1 Tax=Bacillus sp. Hm123 TaxID=3450745 RepID=UPI003F430D4B
MNDSESMLTYRKEDHGNPLVAGAWSWTRKAEGAVHRRQAKDQPARRLFFNLLVSSSCDLEKLVDLSVI